MMRARMRLPHAKLVVAVFAPLLCTACPEGTAPPDAGALQDFGNWEDTGKFASCVLVDNSGLDCGELSSFDLSSCSRSSLGALGAEGAYVMHLRVELGNDSSFSSSAFAVSTDGGTQYVFGTGYAPADSRLKKQVDANTFFLGRRFNLLDGGVNTRALVGCSAPDAERIDGCYAWCTNGTATAQGTFTAKKIVSPARAEDVSKGLTLLGEARVQHGMAVDIWVAKDRAYVASVDWSTRPNDIGGLAVFDIRNPALPTETKFVSSALGDSYGTYWNTVWGKGDALYVGSSAKGLITFDISNPDDPVLAPIGPVDSGDQHTLFIDGDLLYGMGHGGVRIYDISAPLAPNLFRTWIGANPYVHDAFVHRGRLYGFSWGAGLEIADVSSVTSKDPVSLGGYQYPRSSTHAGAVGTYGDRLIAFEGGEDWGAHLRVIDVTNPANTKLIAEYKLRPEVSIHNMILDETKKRLYIAYYHEGVRVLDVADPAAPREIAYYNTFRGTDPYRGSNFYDGAVGMRVVPGADGKNLLFVAETSRGLMIFRED
jgi:hypothetical protein